MWVYQKEQQRFFLNKLFGGSNEGEDPEKKNQNIKEEFLKERERLSNKLKDERDKIDSEIHRYSPLREIKSVLKHKGKLFVSVSAQLSPPDKSTYFPSPEAVLGDGRNKACIKNINGDEVDVLKMIKKCKATLLFVTFTEYGSNMTKPWKEAFEQYTSGQVDSRLQCLDLSISENYVITWLESYVMKNLKSVVPAHMHNNTMVTFLKNNEQTIKFKETLQITNSKTCYVFILDQQGRIRWRAVGSPEGKETEFMLSAIQQLITQPQLNK